MKKSLLRKYARLIVRVGANVRKGQMVRLDVNICNEELALLVADEAYKAGAKLVRVNWISEGLDRISYRRQSLKTLSTVAPWQEAKMQEEVDEIAVRILILSDDPDALHGLNIEKITKSSQAVRKVMKPYRDAVEGKRQWTIAAAPSKRWAKKVFPELTTSKAVEKLWEEILKTVYVSEDTDPVEEWEKYNRSFEEKCAKLNALALDHLEYKSKNGTDFKAGLIPGALWCGGGETTSRGIFFNPNLPTIEIFTSPMKGSAEGTLVSTKPLAYQGQLIRNFSITFENGRAVSCTAEEGKELLQSIIDMDDGSHMLGELALVPCDSPISNSGILFYETLFDENASCHVALGMGFRDVIPDNAKYTLDEIHAMGINDSMTHVDFMVGAPDMTITGVTKDGKKVKIFKNGNWAI